MIARASGAAAAAPATRSALTDAARPGNRAAARRNREWPSCGTRTLR